MNSFWRYLSFAVLLFVAAIAFIALRNWDTVSLAWENASALQEGGAEAESIQTPDDLVAYLGRHPEKASFAVVRPSGEVIDTVRATTKRSLHRLPATALLAGASQAIAQGTYQAGERIALADIGRFALPGLTAAGHERMVDSLTTSGLIRDDSLALKDVLLSVHTFENLAAADWLMMRLSEERLAALPEQLGLMSSTPPFPYGTTYLSWMKDAERRDAGEAVPPFLGDDASGFRRQVYERSRQLARDDSMRSAVTSALSTRGTDLSVRRQRAYALAALPKGTALDYARLMASIRTGKDAGWERMRSILETPVARSPADTLLAGRTLQDTSGAVKAASMQPSPRFVANVAGAHPGILTLAGYVRTDGDASPRVVVLMMHDLPMAVFYQLAQTGIDKGLFLELLMDAEATERLAGALRGTAGRAAAL
ncbi:hypothetical protein [Longibacter sp.]|jgi:hypothetical protein|uniref:hypothetical protein n=1 Tax=Longibacter sp. TaxID=2045415 RepID=UPI003EBFE37F